MNSGYVVELFIALFAYGGIIFAVHLSRDKRIFSFFSLLYFISLIYAVGFRGSRAGVSGLKIVLPLPFYEAVLSGHFTSGTYESLMNILLFIPWGYLFPVFTERYAISADRIAFIENKGMEKTTSCNLRLWQVILSGFLLSLLIEISQYVFHFGVFELDDLIKNTIGTAIGFVIYTCLEGK